MVLVKVISPERLGPSYKRDQQLEVSELRAQRWQRQGIVRVVEPEPVQEPSEPAQKPSTGSGKSKSKEK